MQTFLWIVMFRGSYVTQPTDICGGDPKRAIFNPTTNSDAKLFWKKTVSTLKLVLFSKIAFNWRKLGFVLKNFRPILPFLCSNQGEERRFLDQKGWLITILGFEHGTIINCTWTEFKLVSKLHAQTAPLGLNPVWSSRLWTKNLHYDLKMGVLLMVNLSIPKNRI